MSGENGMPVVLLAWKPMPRNSLRGFAKIRLGKSLVISDIAVHCHTGRRWAQLPSKPMVGKDGNGIRDDAGKLRYVPMLEWTDKAAADRFSEAVLAAVEAGYSGETHGDYKG